MSAMPSLARHGLRGGAVVAGQHDDADSVGPQARQRRRRRRLDRIGDGDDAGGLAVDGNEHGRRAVAPRVRRLGAPERRARNAEILQKLGVADGDLAAVDRAGDALAGDGAEIADVFEVQPALLGGGDDRGGQRMLARPFETGAERQHRRFVEARRPACTATTRGLPSVRVPVLSTTSVSIFSKRSSASAFLIRTPAVAPLPTPTMIDIGVARPSAQGQAMMTTETAATSA